jgi:competence protein CoiA
MLCGIRKSSGETVTASSESGAGRPFVCPVCAGEVILRKGRLRVDHFAHKRSVACAYGEGETEAHRRCKSEIYEALLRSPGVSDVRLERYLKDVRPDVSARVNGVPVAIEVQISNLTVETVIRRTEEYARRGIYLLWLAQWTPRLDSARYSPKPWERWVHAAYFGRVFYWVKGTSVVPYHFDPVHIRVRKHSWRGLGGRKMSGGGYKRVSRRFRQPVRGRLLEILADFDKREREPWQAGETRIPRAKLFSDSGRSFWRNPQEEDYGLMI